MSYLRITMQRCFEKYHEHMKKQIVGETQK